MDWNVLFFILFALLMVFCCGKMMMKGGGGCCGTKSKDKYEKGYTKKDSTK